MQLNRILKPTMLALLVFTLALAACTSTNLPEVNVNGTPQDLPPDAVTQAMEQMSQDLNVSVDEIRIVQFEQVDWPDACLGIPQEGQTCAQVITPGFRVVVEVNNQQYEFRTNQDGTVVVQAP